jgi:hypothetical protein
MKQSCLANIQEHVNVRTPSQSLNNQAPSDFSF